MIERERKRLKIPVARLCRQAGMDAKNYARIRGGERCPRGDTLARLAAALAACKRGDKDNALAGRPLFRLVLAQLAREVGIDVAAALEHKPQQKATANPEWMEISRLRDVACYILNTVLGMSNAEVARAAGVTPPAITVAIRKVEDKREAHPELEAVFSMFEGGGCSERRSRRGQGTSEIADRGSVRAAAARWAAARAAVGGA